MLTIAIPTYNRNELLNDCVKNIIPQMKDGCKLLIVDNNSAVSAKESLIKFGINVDQANIKFIRNLINIGGAANILRCLENCDTEWLYCLGDDDIIDEGAISLILNTIENHGSDKLLYLSFDRFKAVRSCNFKSQGLRDFIGDLDDWSTFLFMSSVVINAAQFKKYVLWGYIYSYTWAPFQAILLKILQNAGGQVLFLSKNLCKEESRSVNSWDSFPVIAGKMILPEIIDDGTLRTKFAKKLTGSSPLLSILYWARVNYRNSSDYSKVKMYISLYISRKAFYCSKLEAVWSMALSKIVLNRFIFPDFILFFILRLIFFIRGRSLPKSAIADADRS